MLPTLPSSRRHPTLLHASSLIKGTAFLADAETDRTRIRVTVDSTSYISGLGGHWSREYLANRPRPDEGVIASGGKLDEANAIHCRRSSPLTHSRSQRPNIAMPLDSPQDGLLR